MQIIGLIGGMSWESTATYYRLINEGVKARLGGLHGARLVLWSVDMAEIERLQHDGDWDACGTILAEAAVGIERAGADFLVLATNTMHRVAPAIEAAVAIPLLHIADATAERLRADGVRRVGLLGTRFTMEQDFYRGRLTERHGLDVLVPEEADRAELHRVIYEELCLGRLREESRATFVRIVADLAARGAEGVILGCTEIGLLLQQSDTPTPLYDTTSLHAAAAVARATSAD